MRRNIADLVVNGVIPAGPFFLHEAAAHSKHGGNSSDLSRVVRLNVADRDQRVAALRHGVRCQPFELPDLVASEGET